MTALNSSVCKTGDTCPFCATNTSVYSSTINCSSSDLSFRCSSDNAPVYATSITVSGLMQDRLVFNDSLSNLKEINIIDCTLHMLQISSNVTIQTLSITNSTIDIAEINDRSNSLRFVQIINSNFDEVNFFPKFEHSFDLFCSQK